MRNITVFLAVLFLSACGTDLDSALQSFGNGLTVLYTADTDPSCTQQVWSLSLSVGVNETDKAGGQLVLRGMDPAEGLTLDLMDHQEPGTQISFSIYNDEPYSWHVESLEVTFQEVTAERIRADYVLVMLDGSTRRGSVDAPVAANPGGCAL